MKFSLIRKALSQVKGVQLHEALQGGKEDHTLGVDQIEAIQRTETSFQKIEQGVQIGRGHLYPQTLKWET